MAVSLCLYERQSVSSATQIIGLGSRMITPLILVGLHSLPADMSNDEGQAKLRAFILQVTRIVSFWNEKSTGLLMDEDSALVFLEAVLPIFQCGLNDEREKPSSVRVRSARKTAFLECRHDGPAAEFFKALQTFPAGKTLMNIAKAHAASGMQDDSASGNFVGSKERLDLKVALLYVDIDEFLSKGNCGKPHDIASWEEVFLDAF